jgi:hypothetical protein
MWDDPLTSLLVLSTQILSCSNPEWRIQLNLVRDDGGLYVLVKSGNYTQKASRCNVGSETRDE